MKKKNKKNFKKTSHHSLIKISPTKTPLSFETEKIKKTKIRIIGIGGGGGNIVSEIAEKVKKVSFVAANTDYQALKKIPPPIMCFQFGENFTHGLGTGMNTQLAASAANEEKEKIKKLFQDQDIVIIIATLGGGVGSGATPVFANISKNLGNITYGIFTLPFKFEGEKKIEIAQEAIEKLKYNLNGYTVFPNDSIFQIIDKKTPLKTAFSIINKNLAESISGLIETLYQPGLINIDFADLKSIFEGKGRLTYLKTVETSGENRAEEAIKKLFSDPLYSYSLKGAKGILFNISGGKNLNLFEVSEISKIIYESANKEAKIIFGLSENKKNEDKLKITLLATGCLPGVFSKTSNVKINKLKKKNKAKKNKVKQIKSKIRNQKKSTLLSSEEKKEEKNEIISPESKQIIEVKVRKNGLQIKKELEEMEKEMLEKEKFWENPAFLRRKK